MSTRGRGSGLAGELGVLGFGWWWLSFRPWFTQPLPIGRCSTLRTREKLEGLSRCPWGRSATIVLLTLGWSGGAHASRTGWGLLTGSGLTWGISPSAEIRRVHLQTGLERHFSSSFSAGIELSGARFVGTRADSVADAVSVSVLPVVRWTFLRLAPVNTYFDFGFGGAFFTPAFPPGGTRLNGHSTFGVGLEFSLRSDVALRLQLRQMHHSNGRGFVTENPAFDGVTCGVVTSWSLE